MDKAQVAFEAATKAFNLAQGFVKASPTDEWSSKLTAEHVKLFNQAYESLNISTNQLEES